MADDKRETGGQGSARIVTSQDHGVGNAAKQFAVNAEQLKPAAGSAVKGVNGVHGVQVQLKADKR